MMDRLINAIAPVRICDNGGWTDTWFAEYGNVLSIAVQPGVRLQLHVSALNGPVQDEVADPLLRAVITALPPPPGMKVQVSTSSLIPPGSSTGTSAAVSVALIGALLHLRGERHPPMVIARLAHRIETEFAGRQCGVQDQIAAAFGGINFMQITRYPESIVTPIKLDNALRQELQSRLTLIDVGKAHCSTEVHEMVIKELEGAGPNAEKLKPLREAAIRSRDALLNQDLCGFGRAMIDNTEAQERLHSNLIGSGHRKIIEAARRHGAWGWKVNGAGGDGGSVSILHGPSLVGQKQLLESIKESEPAFKVIPITLDIAGLQVWESTFPNQDS